MHVQSASFLAYPGYTAGANPNSAELPRSLQVLGHGRHTEAGQIEIGIGLCRFVVASPGILGLASSGLGADLGLQIDEFRPDS